MGGNLDYHRTKVDISRYRDGTGNSIWVAITGNSIWVAI